MFGLLTQLLQEQKQQQQQQKERRVMVKGQFFLRNKTNIMRYRKET